MNDKKPNFKNTQEIADYRFKNKNFEELMVQREMLYGIKDVKPFKLVDGTMRNLNDEYQYVKKLTLELWQQCFE